MNLPMLRSWPQSVNLTIAIEIIPVICGSSFKNKGVQNLLDAVIDYMPAPTDIPAIKGIDANTEAAKLSVMHQIQSRFLLLDSRL